MESFCCPTRRRTRYLVPRAVVCSETTLVSCVSSSLPPLFFSSVVEHLPFFPIGKTKWQCVPILYKTASCQPEPSRWEIIQQSRERWKWDICRGKFCRDRGFFTECKRESRELVSPRNLSLFARCHRVSRDSRNHALFSSRCYNFDKTDNKSLSLTFYARILWHVLSLSLCRTTSPAGYGGGSGLSRRFLWRYFIIQNSGHIHRISIEMAADVAAAIGRRALFETSSWSLVVASRSAGLIARNFIAIFLICDDYIIIMPHHSRRIQLSALGCVTIGTRVCISSAKIIFVRDGKLAQIPSRHKMECIYLLQVKSDGIHKFRSNSTCNTRGGVS